MQKRRQINMNTRLYLTCPAELYDIIKNKRANNLTPYMFAGTYQDMFAYSMDELLQENNLERNMYGEGIYAFTTPAVAKSFAENKTDFVICFSQDVEKNRFFSMAGLARYCRHLQENNKIIRHKNGMLTEEEIAQINLQKQQDFEYASDVSVYHQAFCVVDTISIDDVKIYSEPELICKDTVIADKKTQNLPSVKKTYLPKLHENIDR